MNKKLIKVSDLKKVKTFKGTNIPYFEVIIPETVSNSGLLMWGIGETTSITNLTHLNDDYDGVNRKVKHPHKGVVGNAMLQHGYACGIAICIFNGKLYRVDGNHRAEFLADNGHPIRFAYRKCETLQEVVDIMIGFNNSAKNWGIKDYISAYATMGLEAYIVLQKQINAHELTPSVTASLVGGVSIGLAKKQIRNGELVCDNENAAGKRVNEVRTFLQEINHVGQRSAEGLLHFFGNVSFAEFKAIKKDFIKEVVHLIGKGILISKGAPSSKDYERVYIKAYQNIK